MSTPDLIKVGRVLPMVAVRLMTMAAVAVALFMLWPAPLGGQALFVIVHGTSMEPTYHAGDTLYARTSSEFHLGQTAIYRVPAGQPGADNLVIHRIQARTPTGHYVMQGDNRSADDGALPGPDDLLAHPIVDLGPLPRRLLIMTPWTMLLVVAITLGWYLWPPPEDSNERAPSIFPVHPVAHSTVQPSTAPVIQWITPNASQHVPNSGATAMPAFAATTKGPRSIPKVGLSLSGPWATWRDATLEILHQRGVAQLIAPDPFGPDLDPLSIDDLIGFIGAADHALASPAKLRCHPADTT